MLTNLNPFYSALLSVVFIVASKKNEVEAQ
jgi:hypothetical protein